MLDTVASYQYMQFQGTLMNQTRENGEKKQVECTNEPPVLRLNKQRGEGICLTLDQKN